MQITSKSTYLRDESFNGVKAAVVETKSDGTIDLANSAGVAAAGPSGIAIKGTLTTDVTTWIDPNGHRIMKSHSTSKDELTMILPASTRDHASPTIQGPLTAKGEATTDLTPA